MARTKRIDAADAERNQWYRTKTSNRIKLLIKPHKHMGIAPAANYVPYYCPPNPRAKSSVDRFPHKGWLPPDYPLLPID